MRYETRDKLRAERAARAEAKIKRYQLFEEADSFDEYELKAVLNGVAKHKLADPLWWHYQLEDHPVKFSVLAWIAGLSLMLPVWILLVCLLRGLMGLGVATVISIGMTSIGVETLRCQINLACTRLRGLWVEHDTSRKYGLQTASSSANSLSATYGGGSISISLTC